MLRSSNPALNDSVFTRQPALAGDVGMTLQGTVNKTLILATLLVLAGGVSWRVVEASPGLSGMLMGGCGIAAFVVAMVSCFKPAWSPALAPAYAVLKGAALGVISLRYAALYDGIVLQAALLTLGVLFALLFAYQSRLIRATENFKLGLTAATMGILLFYLATMVLGFFGVRIPFLHESGPLGIGFSLVVVVIAALNLVMDFDFIENGVQMRAAKHMEWQAALGLLITVVWLYIEMLRLLSKLRKE